MEVFTNAGKCEKSGGGCAPYVKSCANAEDTSSFSSCNGWLSTCTFDNTNNVCVAISDTCAE